MRCFDLHCDTVSVLFDKNEDLDGLSAAVNNSSVGVFDNYTQCFALFSEFPDRERFFAAADYAEKILPNFSGEYILTVENMAPLAYESEPTAVLHGVGVSAATLTWNGENDFAGGVGADSGLKPLGRRTVKEFSEYGIILDVSHLNRQSFYDVADCADCLFASHTALSEVNGHPRNITAEQAKIISEKGGIIGVCFYPTFSLPDIFEGVYRNIYILGEKVGCDCIALGSDFDGARMAPELDGPDKLPALYAYLKRRGLSDDILNKVFYGNAEKFFKSRLINGNPKGMK